MSLWSLLRGPVQIAYAVDDVIGAAESCVARGAGPFFVRHHIDVTNSRVHGRTVHFDHSSAYGQWGNVMVELLCEHHADPEPGERVQRVGPLTGLHHMAFFVDDVSTAQDALVEHGWAEALYAEAGNTQFAMHDATAELGHLVEIYRDSGGLVQFYDMVRAAATDWDGSDPIRIL